MGDKQDWGRGQDQVGMRAREKAKLLKKEEESKTWSLEGYKDEMRPE